MDGPVLHQSDRGSQSASYEDQARLKRIFEYVESWYNSERIHSSIGYMTAVEFERRYYQLHATKVS
ncbi:DUF4080 domain-containing protein [Alicyclobacillus herbarius]|uniref:DUF4080 domain-containing protein n=1 Tax=Alicyclobacillus herbarius TaxID=122960 RepID=UPI003CCBF94F